MDSFGSRLCFLICCAREKFLMEAFTYMHSLGLGEQTDSSDFHVNKRSVEEMSAPIHNCDSLRSFLACVRKRPVLVLLPLNRRAQKIENGGISSNTSDYPFRAPSELCESCSTICVSAIFEKETMFLILNQIRHSSNKPS